MMTLIIAFRNLFRQRRRSLMTILSMAGGYFFLSISLSIAEGTYAEIIRKFTKSMTGHVQIHREGYLERASIYKSFTPKPSLANEIAPRLNSVTSCSRLTGAALFYANEKSVPAPLKGVDFACEDQMSRLADRLSSGVLPDADSRNMLIGRRLARRLKVDVGDEVVAVSQGADGSIANDLFRVDGVVGDLGDFDESLVRMPLPLAQEFFSLGNRVHEMVFLASRVEDTDFLAGELRRHLIDEPLRVSPWYEVEAEFYRSMQADKQGNEISLVIIMIMVAISVLNTVLMSVLERTREYGLLRSLGARPSLVFLMVVLESATLACLGIIFGFALALPVNYWFVVKGIEMDSAIEVGGMVFERLVGEISLVTMALPAAVVLVTTVVVSLLPAMRAAKIRPTDALRAT